MSKKPTFDREQVIANATNLYWEKGYHGTSMRNLQDAIDMRPGSIYAAFGSKDGVFKASLEHYAQLGINQLASVRAESPSPLAALKTFVTQSVIDTKADGPSCVCMLAKTVTELTAEHQDLLDVALNALSSVEKQFENLFIEAQSVGEVSANKSAAELAKFLQVQVTGMRVYAKTCEGNEPLIKMIDELFYHFQQTN